VIHPDVLNHIALAAITTDELGSSSYEIED
jgi:hypothetical protein